MAGTAAWLQFGVVLEIYFPFTSGDSGKPRPAVVVSPAAYQRARPDVVLLAISTNPDAGGGYGDAPIVDWRAAGLSNESFFKPVIFTGMQAKIRGAIGRLVPADEATLREVLAHVIG